MENRLEHWDSRWKNNKFGWHSSDVNFALADHGKSLLPTSNRRILVPLCGKSLDLKWFYDAGHTVVGIEAIEKPVIDFFTEHDLSYVIEETDSAKLFKSEDGRLMIYCCDLFMLKAEVLGKFDSVWDRGSLVAIYEEDRDRYAELIKSVLAKDFRYLVNVMQYQPTEEFSGPPRNIPLDLLKQLYGDMCNVEVLQNVDCSDDEKVKVWGLDEVHEVVVLLSPKQ